MSQLPLTLHSKNWLQTLRYLVKWWFFGYFKLELVIEKKNKNKMLKSYYDVRMVNVINNLGRYIRYSFVDHHPNITPAKLCCNQ